MASSTGFTTVILLRHGKTEWNELGKLQGSSDSPLLPSSLAQARAIGQRIARSALGPSVAAVYSSPLGRARQTADLVVAGLARPLPVALRAALSERSYGAWEGLTWGEIEGAYPEDFRRYRRGVAEAPLPGGGESAGATTARIGAALTAIAAAHAGETIIVVTHSGCTSLFARDVLQLKPGASRRFGLENDAVNILRWTADKQEWHLALWGDVGHLAPVQRGASAAVAAAAGFAAGMLVATLLVIAAARSSPQSR